MESWEVFLDRESCMEKLRSEHPLYKQKGFSQAIEEVQASPGSRTKTGTNREEEAGKSFQLKLIFEEITSSAFLP